VVYCLDFDGTTRVTNGGSPQHVRDTQAAILESLFREHYASLCSYAYRHVGSRAHAEEVVQDVFLSVWKLRQRRNLADIKRSYLFKAVRNRALDSARDHRRATDLRHRLTLYEARHDDRPDVDMRQREIARAVKEAVQDLPDRCRETFLLVRQDGLTYREAATVLGVSAKTVDAQLVRAAKLLRKRLAHVREV